MGDTLLRQWTMLRAIPRAPRKKSTPDLVEHLRAEGFDVTARTVQRDLNKLSGSLFPLHCDERDTTHAWQWPRDVEILDIPAMEPQTALAFWMAREHLQRLLPPNTLRALHGHFDQAQKVLSSNSPVSSWPEKVRVVSRGQPLIPPSVNGAVLETVYEALRIERRFKARYRRRQDQQPRDYDVNPLGLVLRGSVVYLICTVAEYEDPLQFALHRMDTAELTDTPTHAPPGFDLDEYLQQNYLDFRLGDPLRLHIRIDSEIAKHLEETPLAEDQHIGPDEHGWRKLTATVSDTSQLRWWLMGFGSGVEVVGPIALRDEIAGALSLAASVYQPELRCTDKE